ncbi:MAG: winged helix DNA-binding domain-containing protein [Clostridia bacterium]|nr:winged helix DNA-binding domain-containing protein [Clostridia bacterium]
MESIQLSKQEAKRFLIKYHGLDGAETFHGKEGILQYIKRVGCIQFDPLNVVGHNPDLVLQSRIRGYKVEMLEELLYKDRSLIDGWDKMMAIYLTEDWPKFARIRREREKELIWVLEGRGSSGAIGMTDQVRSALLERGPMLSTQLKLGSGGIGTWGHKNLSGVAMDYMFNIGELGVFAKRNTQKIYDLIERLLPKELLDCNDPFETDRAFYKWYFERRVGSIGMLWSRFGGGWLGYYLNDKALRESVLSELVEDKHLQCITIEGFKDVFYMRPQDAKLLEDKGHEHEEKVSRILAPLDNLLWDRDLVTRLFGFTYTWEVYVPAVKRKYGYYVLPVLYGDELVARFEPDIQRGSDPLRIKNWWWEEGLDVSKELKSAVKKELKAFCKYLGASGVDPESLKLINAKSRGTGTK